MNPRTARGGWRSNGRKVQWREAGITGLVQKAVFRLSGARSAVAGRGSRSESDDRAFAVAKKRVTPVERRDAGKVEA